MTARSLARGIPWTAWRGAWTARARLRGLLLPGLGLALIAAFLLGLGLGAVPISPLEISAILVARLGVTLDVATSEQQAAVLLSIRLPRVLLAGVIGAGLAISGATLQGIFRNPLAEPAIIGVSSGAAVGAVASIVFGLTLLGGATLPVAAFVGGVITTLAVYALARRGGRTEVVTLVLTGVAINAMAGAVIGFMTFLANDAQLRNIIFWTLGGLGGATWGALATATPFIVVGIVVMPFFARSLNLLVLGESEARHLGVPTERVRLLLIVLATLATSAGVAVAGIIGFVGLVVPHMVRLVGGPDHRLLLPASALLGAALLIMADLGTRMLARPAELPLGVVTALIGAPVFLYLLQRTRQQQGGWG